MIHLTHMKKVRPLKYGSFLQLHPTETHHPTQETEERDRVSLSSFQCILILTVVDVLEKADADISSKIFVIYFVFFLFLQQTVDQLRSILRQADDLAGLEVEQAEEIGDDEAPSQLLHRLERAETLNKNSLIKHANHIGGIMRRLQLRVDGQTIFYQMLREGNLNFKEFRVKSKLVKSSDRIHKIAESRS